MLTRPVTLASPKDTLPPAISRTAELEVGVLPVRSGAQHRVGIVSLGDVALHGDRTPAEAAVSVIAEAGGSPTRTG